MIEGRRKCFFCKKEDKESHLTLKDSNCIINLVSCFFNIASYIDYTRIFALKIAFGNGLTLFLNKSLKKALKREI